MGHMVTFEGYAPVFVPEGTLLSEAAAVAGAQVAQPCGGQGRCGRCTLQVLSGEVHRRSTLRLTPAEVESGYALACGTLVQGDVEVRLLPQETLERRLATDRVAAEVRVPGGYEATRHQCTRRVRLTLTPPSMDDQTDDLSRLRTALRAQAGASLPDVPLAMLRRLGALLRQDDWCVTAVLHLEPDGDGELSARLIDLMPGHIPDDEPLWGAAIDIGTTTVTLWLVDLVTGQVRAQASEYNRQITRGEDVISRIVYASKLIAGKDLRRDELRQLALQSIHELLEVTCKQAGARPAQVVKAVIAANSTMVHLLLGLPADSIRLAPFVTVVNEIPLLRAQEVGLNIHPDGVVDCLPGVASYVGSDITAGVLSSGLDETHEVTLFMDVGTNGEMVLGTREWLVTCACSAGPAFEGAGVVCGMRATRGAIEEVWINSETREPTYRVIGGRRPRGLCGSGLISLLAEMFMTGVIDKAGNIKEDLDCKRIRSGEHGPEYVIAWAGETETRQDIVITKVDIDNLLRAKAAIYAGYTILADSVGLPFEAIERMLIGGSFGKYINIEKAVQIGLLPDLPWERFDFLGNTSVKGAYYALLSREAREKIAGIASRMTYIELSADNGFYEAFTSALFLPHTEAARFPSVIVKNGHKKIAESILFQE